MIEELNEIELVNVNLIMEIIKEQFNNIRRMDFEYYSQFDVEITNEQFYVPDDDRDGHKIYIVVKFLAADIDFGQNVMPVTIQAVSEANALNAAQRLLFEYAQTFNQNTLKKDGKLVYQNYSSPSVINNFEVVYDGYRSLLMMSGSLLVSSNINRIFLYYYNFSDEEVEYVDNINDATKKYAIVGPDCYKKTTYTVLDALPDEKLKDFDYIISNGKAYEWKPGFVDGVLTEGYFETNEVKGYLPYQGLLTQPLTYQDSFNATPDTQPYYDTKNFTESINKYGTFTFTVSTYLTNDVLNNLILDLVNRKVSINRSFYFKVQFDNGQAVDIRPYKLISAGRAQNIAEMPVMTMAFTN